MRRAPLVRRLLALAILVGAATPAWALDPDKRLGDCPLELWRVRDGLPGGWVRGITQTEDGYLWIGAFGGLTRFDGQRMTPILSQDRFRRVADVNALSIGANGRLWVIPSYGGPVCIRGRELENCLAEVAPLEPNTRLASSVTDGNGVFLIGRHELYRYAEGRAHLVIRYADAPWKRLNGLGRDAQGRLWLATDSGLWLLGDLEKTGSGSLPKIERPPGLGESEVSAPAQAILRLRSGTLMVALQDRLLRMETGGTLQLSVEGAAQGYPGSEASALLEDRDGNLWIGTTLGLVRRKASGTFERFGAADGLPDPDITALFEDREGSLWVGMRAGGLAQLTDRSLDTRHGPAVLRHQVVQSVAQDRSGTFWFASHQGLVRWKDGESKVLGLADGLENLRLTSVRPTRDGALWIGSETGLQRLVGGKLETWLKGGTPVLAMTEDRSGRLWVGSEGRVGRVDPGGKLQWLPAEQGARWEGVRAIEEDDQGTIWVAAIGGLARVEGGRLVRGNWYEGKRLPSARSIHRDGQGTLWFGTNGGLLRRRDGRFQQFAAAQGLVAEQIYQVLTDDVGYVWMGTGRGLHRVAISELAALSAGQRSQVSPAWFDTSDERRDLAVTNVRQPGAWRALDGRLWFATDHGVVVVDPKRPHVNTRPPSILIEEALVDGRPARTGDPAEGSGMNEFPAGNGNLEFRFAVITTIEPRKSQLRYRLEGFDGGWNDAGPRREARYIRVPPGRYRFRVQGANADGVWNEAGASVELRIAPHFYRTTWFYALGALGLMSLIWLLYRFRVDRLRRDYLAAFSERSRVARELHDTLLQSMAAVAMHLRGVRRRLEPVSQPASRELETIENMVTLSLEETRRFVWNLREQPIGSGDLGRALGQLAERITAGRAPAAEVAVHGEVVALPNTVQSDLFRIAQEALANAVKHADARRIEVILEYQATMVQLSVIDDGKGFDPATAQGASAGHFGLVGMRERAARMGTFSLESRPGAGTKVVVTVPVKREQRAVPAALDERDKQEANR